MRTLDFDEKTLPFPDRPDFPKRLSERLAAGKVSPAQARLLENWSRDGYVLLPQAIPEELIDAVLADYERGWEERPPVSVMSEGLGAVPWRQMPPRSELSHHHYRVLDIQDWSLAARRVMLHENIVSFLAAMLDDTVIAMQSLLFEYSSEQHAHQDFAYVQSRILSHLAGAWVALEDVSSANGGVCYFPGSHRIPKFDWGNGQLYYDATKAGGELLFAEHLERECAAAGISRQVLDAKKGDVFLWHAALVHGGATPDDRERTRLSFVSHYSSATAYPRDRRFPDREPNRFKLNGAELYVPNG